MALAEMSKGSCFRHSAVQELARCEVAWIMWRNGNFDPFTAQKNRHAVPWIVFEW